MRFFSVLTKVCTTPSVFPRLINVSLLKALAHFFVLSVLCVIFIIICRTWSVFSSVTHTCKKLGEHTGGIRLTDKGIYPVKNPQKEKYLYLHKNIGLIYFPDYNRDISILSTYAKSGVLWFPHFIVYWKRLNAKSILFWPFFISPGFPQSQMLKLRESQIVSIIHINSWLKKRRKILNTKLSHEQQKKTEKNPTSRNNFRENGITLRISSLDFIIATFLLVLGIKYALLPLAMMILFLIFYNGICVLVYHFLSVLSPKKITLPQLFVISIYAGFPPLIVASLFTAFDLPFLDYQTIYLFGFLIYFFIAIGKIDNNKKPRKTAEL